MTRKLCCLALFITSAFPDFAPAGRDPVLAPEQIIRKAIDARGGEEAIRKILLHRYSLKGLMFRNKMKAPVKIDVLYRRDYPSYRLDIEINPPDTDVITERAVFNGKKLWYKSNGVTREGSDVELDTVRVGVMYNSEIGLLFPLLDKKRFRLTILPTVEIKDKITAGIRVSSQGYPDLCLYFDKQTWLLVKSEYVYKGTNHEEFFEGHKRIKGGTLFAAKKTIVVNGNKQFELELVDVELLTEVKDSEFSRP